MMRSSSRARWTSGTTSACPSWRKELKTRQPCSPSKHSVSTLPRATTWVDRCPRTSSNNGSLTTATHSRCSPKFRFEQGTQASSPSVGQVGYRSRGRKNSRHHQTVEKSPWALVEGCGGLGLRRCCGHGFSAASWVGGVRRGVPAGARLHLRALSADGAQARGRQLRQRHPGLSLHRPRDSSCATFRPAMEDAAPSLWTLTGICSRPASSGTWSSSRGQPVHRWPGGCLCHGCLPCGHRARRAAKVTDRATSVWVDHLDAAPRPRTFSDHVVRSAIGTVDGRRKATGSAELCALPRACLVRHRSEQRTSETPPRNGDAALLS